MSSCKTVRQMEFAPPLPRKRTYCKICKPLHQLRLDVARTNLLRARAARAMSKRGRRSCARTHARLRPERIHYTIQPTANKKATGSTPAHGPLRCRLDRQAGGPQPGPEPCSSRLASPTHAHMAGGRALPPDRLHHSEVGYPQALSTAARADSHAARASIATWRTVTAGGVGTLRAGRPALPPLLRRRRDGGTTARRHDDGARTTA